MGKYPTELKILWNVGFWVDTETNSRSIRKTVLNSNIPGHGTHESPVSKHEVISLPIERRKKIDHSLSNFKPRLTIFSPERYIIYRVFLRLWKRIEMNILLVSKIQFSEFFLVLDESSGGKSQG